MFVHLSICPFFQPSLEMYVSPSSFLSSFPMICLCVIHLSVVHQLSLLLSISQSICLTICLPSYNLFLLSVFRHLNFLITFAHFLTNKVPTESHFFADNSNSSCEHSAGAGHQVTGSPLILNLTNKVLAGS